MMLGMIYTILTKLLKLHLFIVLSEKFKSESSELFVERYVAKHHLLRPEFIVVNDQVHGFKKTSEALKSLEEFPIYLEIEYSQTEDQEKLIENIDLYAESHSKSSGKLTDIGYLANLYSKTVSIEHIYHLNIPGEESLIIYSKINDILTEGYLEEDLKEGLVSETEISLMVEVYLLGFLNILKRLDEILVKSPKV